MFVNNRLMIKSFNTYIRLFSSKKTHYEVLHLGRNCTEKEIKDAFIQMSKEFHPDKNKDHKAQEKFVEIVEAYNVLGKASSRAQYDILTGGNKRYNDNCYPPSNMYNHTPYNIRKNAQYTYTYHYEANAHRTQEPAEEKSKSYYGVTGVTKKPNYVIIMMCCGFALFGLVVQMLIIRRAFKVHQENVNERSRMLAEELDRVREAANTNGNKIQSRLLLEKIVNAANPTIATASLGQALANEKKDFPVVSPLTEYGDAEPKTEDSPFKSSIKESGVGIQFESWHEDF